MTATDELDLSGFLAAHAMFREEFGLLAAVANTPLDAARAAATEGHADLVLKLLHVHHTVEDDHMWPLLRERAPAAAADLDRLEAQHERLDALIAAATDRARSMAARAGVLTELHEALGEHLNDEERLAVPLLRRHLTPAEGAHAGEHAIAAMSGTERARMLGFVACRASGTDLALFRSELPALLRWLLRLWWAPAYARRLRLVYG